MSKMVNGKWSGWTLLVASTVVATLLLLSGGAPSKAQESPNARTPAAMSPSGSVIEAGIARSEFDVLDLQLD